MFSNGADQSLRHAHVRQRAHVGLRHLQPVVGGEGRAPSPSARRRRTGARRRRFDALGRRGRRHAALRVRRHRRRDLHLRHRPRPVARSAAVAPVGCRRPRRRGQHAGLDPLLSYGGDGGNAGNGSLAAYDLRRDHLLWQRSYGTGVDSFALTPNGRTIYLPTGELSSGNEWLVIDARTGDRTATIHGGRGPHNTVVSLDGAFAYLGGRTDRYLYVARTRDNRIVRRVGPLKPDVRPFTINGRRTLAFTTASAFLGFQMSDLTTGKVLYTVGVPGFRSRAVVFAQHAEPRDQPLARRARAVSRRRPKRLRPRLRRASRRASSSEARREHQAAASVHRQRVAVQQRLRKGRLGPARSQRSVRVRGRLGRRDRHAITTDRRLSPRASRDAKDARDRLARRPRRRDDLTLRRRLRALARAVAAAAAGARPSQHAVREAEVAAAG